MKIDPGLHRDYLSPVEATLGSLSEVYPSASLGEVRLFEKKGDRSLAHVEGSDIVLNALWFSRRRTVLDRAGSDGRASLPFGMPLWHGGAREPEHLLTHEFGHILAASLPDGEKFSRDGYAAVLADPSVAVSGYAIVDPDEWFAETFAILRLGHGASPQVAHMEAFLVR